MRVEVYLTLVVGMKFTFLVVLCEGSDLLFWSTDDVYDDVFWISRFFCWLGIIELDFCMMEFCVCCWVVFGGEYAEVFSIVFMEGGLKIENVW